MGTHISIIFLVFLSKFLQLKEINTYEFTILHKKRLIMFIYSYLLLTSTLKLFLFREISISMQYRKSHRRHVKFSYNKI